MDPYENESNKQKIEILGNTSVLLQIISPRN